MRPPTVSERAGVERRDVTADVFDMVYASDLTSIPPIVPPLDAARLEEASGGDPEFVAEILDLYLGDCASNLVKLAQAVAERRLDKIASLAHMIKGSSANVGATTMQSLASRLESLSKRGEHASIDVLVRRLGTELERVRAHAKR